MKLDKIVFASYAESTAQISNACRLAESVRTFGGHFSSVPVAVYSPLDFSELPADLMDRAGSVHLGIEYSDAPEEALRFYYAGKVYAAARAEKLAEQNADILVWLDEDTIIIDEPIAFELSPDTALAYCPVMHNRSGVRYEEQPDEFWARIYRLLNLTPDLLFPMVTPADRQKIKAYFHCGLLSVRPERGLLRRWLADFEKLYRDPEIADMCRRDRTRLVFLHQTALTGAVLHTLRRDEMLELPGAYNYPIFFDRQFEAHASFDSVDGVVTVRHVVSDENLGPNWHRELKGPADKVGWLYRRISGSQPG
jgi:hypothetical protein